MGGDSEARFHLPLGSILALMQKLAKWFVTKRVAAAVLRDV